MTAYLTPVGSSSGVQLTPGAPVSQAQLIPVGQPPPPGAPLPSLGRLADVDGIADAPVDTPLVFRKGPDGVFRPEPAAVSGVTPWGDQVRFSAAPPADPAAPPGAIQVDWTTGTIYEALED